MPPHHPKQDFQVERIAFFSDAVYAIAITLLVIDIRVPEIGNNSTQAEVWQLLKHLRFQFFALLVSFVLIAGYWSRHHTLFKHVMDYNQRVVAANMLTLLPLLFFPFTTAFFYENLNHENIIFIPFRLFLVNNIAAGITIYYFYWLLTHRYTEMIYPFSKPDRRVFEWKLVVTTSCFGLMFVLSFFTSFQNSFLGLLPALSLPVAKRLQKN